MILKIYTDGACNNYRNKHYGSWSFVPVVDGKAKKPYCGISTSTTPLEMVCKIRK